MARSYVRSMHSRASRRAVDSTGKGVPCGHEGASAFASGSTEKSITRPGTMGLRSSFEAAFRSLGAGAAGSSSRTAQPQLMPDAAQQHEPRQHDATTLFALAGAGAMTTHDRAWKATRMIMSNRANIELHYQPGRINWSTGEASDLFAGAAQKLDVSRLGKQRDPLRAQGLRWAAVVSIKCCST